MAFRYQYEDGSILEFGREPTLKEIEQAGINAGAIQPTFRQKFDQTLMGGFQSIMKAPTGLMQLSTGISAALNPFKTLKDYSEEARWLQEKTGIATGQFVPGSPEAKTFQETFIQPQNKYQAGGQLAGDIGQFFLEAPITGVSKVQRLAIAPLIDTALQVSQDVGGGQSTPKEIMRNAMLTAGTSILAGVFMPTKNINWMKMGASGALTGYVSDVATGLTGARGEDREGLKSLIPGLGTAAGTAIGFGTGALTRFSKTGQMEQIRKNRYEALQQLESDHPAIRAAFDNVREQGYDPVNVLAWTDALNDTTTKSGKIDMGKPINRLDMEMEPMEPHVYNVLKEEGTTITVKQYAKGLADVLQSSRLQMDERVALQNKIKKLIEVGKEIAKQNGGVIPLYKLQARKTSLGAQIRRQYGTVKGSTNKEVVRAYKELIEKYTTSMDVKAYNEILQQLYTFRAALRSLHGKVIEGGRLGRYTQTLLGSYIGGQLGGPLGIVIGGDAASRIKSARNKAYFGKLQTPMVQGEYAQAKAKTNRQSNNLGSRKTNQSPTTNQTKKSISPSIPQKKPQQPPVEEFLAVRNRALNE